LTPECNSEAESSLPVFVNDKMTSGECLRCFRELLKDKFNPLTIMFYMSGWDKSDFLVMAIILDGMICLNRMDLFKELADLWAYYVSLQENPELQAMTDLLQLVNARRYPLVMDRLLLKCKTLGFLSKASRESLIVSLLSRDPSFSLSLDSLKYIYSLTSEELDQKMMLADLSFEFYKRVGIEVSTFNYIVKGFGAEDI